MGANRKLTCWKPGAWKTCFYCQPNLNSHSSGIWRYIITWYRTTPGSSSFVLAPVYHEGVACVPLFCAWPIRYETVAFHPHLFESLPSNLSLSANKMLSRFLVLQKRLHSDELVSDICNLEIGMLEFSWIYDCHMHSMTCKYWGLFNSVSVGTRSVGDSRNQHHTIHSIWSGNLNISLSLQHVMEWCPNYY